MNAARWFWTIWLIVVFGSFLGKEIPSLRASDGGTLSEFIWWLCGKRDGVSYANPLDWTAGHWLIGGMLTVGLFWLIVHFEFGLGR